MEVYWGPRCQAYVSPVAEDETCVAVISRDPKLRVAEALAELPLLQRRIRDALPASREMGALSMTRKLRYVYRGRLALLGDASGSVDAITGEGMCLSFKQAAVLAQAIKDGRLSDYQEQHAKLSSRPHSMAALMFIALESNTSLRRRVLASLAKRRHVFESLLAIHVGRSSFFDLWPRSVVEFGSAFLAG
jgi:flavin-dependent dehydrogenase